MFSLEFSQKLFLHGGGYTGKLIKLQIFFSMYLYPMAVFTQSPFFLRNEEGVLFFPVKARNLFCYILVYLHCNTKIDVNGMN